MIEVLKNYQDFLERDVIALEYDGETFDIDLKSGESFEGSPEEYPEFNAFLGFLGGLRGKHIYQKDEYDIITLGELGQIIYIDIDEIDLEIKGRILDHGELTEIDEDVVFFLDDLLGEENHLEHQEYTEDGDKFWRDTWLIPSEDYQKLTTQEAIKNYRLKSPDSLIYERN